LLLLSGNSSSAGATWRTSTVHSQARHFWQGAHVGWQPQPHLLLLLLLLLRLLQQRELLLVLQLLLSCSMRQPQA
jgi:hypothetical protein